MRYSLLKLQRRFTTLVSAMARAAQNAIHCPLAPGHDAARSERALALQFGCQPHKRVLDKTGSALLVARKHLRDGWESRKAYVQDDNSHTGV
jgi:hypothetical protein